MDLEKLKPWNWFKHEEGDSDKGQQIPVSRETAESLPVAGSASLSSLHNAVDRWFEEAMKSFNMPSLLGRGKPGGLSDSKFSSFFRPNLDISGDANCYEITLDVPGMNESDLELEVVDDVLTIKGQKEVHNEDKSKNFYRVERSYGSFQRTLALPDDANADEIKANLDKGVLQKESAA